MAKGFIFNAALEANARGEIDFARDPFKVMLVTSAYRPDRSAAAKRSDVRGEVSGKGYKPGGLAISTLVTNDAVNDRIDILLGAASWPGSTITAAGAVYYKDNGAPEKDELIAFADFEVPGGVISTNGMFSLPASTYRTQNIVVSTT